MLTTLGQKGQKEYVCEKCDFKCSKKYSWNRHILTLKHLNIDKCLQNVDKNVVNVVKEQNKPFQCLCGKSYFHRQSLSHHKKTCNNVPQKLDDNIMIKLVMDVVKSNSEMHKQVLDIFSKFTSSTEDANKFYEKLSDININVCISLLQQYLLKYIDNPQDAIKNIREIKTMYDSSHIQKEAGETGLYN